MSPMKVVMTTFSGDLTGKLGELRRHLEARGAEVLRFDTDRFPGEAQAWFRQDGGREQIRLRCDGHEICLEPGDAIWYRRARWAEKLPPSLNRQLRHGCVLESEALLRGLIAAAPCFVMDPPDLVRERGHKPAQQRLARELGLATPRTLMTNDPAEAREFVASCRDGAIAKMLSGFAVIDDDGREQVVFTTSLRDDHLARLDGLRLAPMVFQEQIRKRLELRITVVGSRMFTAAVDSQKVAGAEVDWRERGVTLLPSWSPYELPADVARALERYMQRIGMQYSAIDMLVEPDGRHVFLEANPAGECFWLEHYAPHFPLTEAIADVLVGVPGARRPIHS
ncbi:MvdC/MvdD family ATP grasp protein [Nannocystis sp. SCPEA4]|uniref:MvdC/MvdD family ATP grasp protein n=1 Tax=Nannocystis sp. SCPEA4 TaxID=2996787 RepID=UPI00226F0355|nr:MvdD family ATP-grasp ribosomal peptide maturase [Nannocystis sp. SCPEA4]MCY1060242.1 MvdD family ATP-grasp ribosomal peptide maturase [Nannocystis sp. SCPEA4]